MTEEGAGSYTMAYCHECQGLVSLAGDGFIHLNGTPLCKRGSAITEENPFDAARVAYEAGQRDAIAAAVQRVEAIADDPDSGVGWNWDYDIDPSGMTRNPLVWIREAVAAIKNEVK